MREVEIISKTHIGCRLPTGRDTLQAGLQVLRHLHHVALHDVGILGGDVDRQLGILGPYRGHTFCCPNLALEQSVVLQQDRGYLQGPVF